MYTQPGKKLMFMGNEFAQRSEWNHDGSLEWNLLQYAPHRQMQTLVSDLNRLYSEETALQLDCEPAGFEWVDADDKDNCVLSYLRKDLQGNVILCIFNFTPVPRHNYQVGVPHDGLWQEIFNSDSATYGGSGAINGGVEAAPLPRHARATGFMSGSGRRA
jgi:1,4-alpha-glucan branching enzyme